MGKNGLYIKGLGAIMSMQGKITSNQMKTVARDLLTFDRLLTGPVVHLIYWAGLGVIGLLGFGLVGGAIGLTMRDATIAGLLIAIPVFVGGVLVLAATALVWRAICEFYVAVFRISEDLRALRQANTPQASDE
jgi:hypothetical protein